MKNIVIYVEGWDEMVGCDDLTYVDIDIQVAIEDETGKSRSKEEEHLRLKEELDKLKQNMKELNDSLKLENINKNTLLQVSAQLCH